MLFSDVWNSTMSTQSQQSTEGPSDFALLLNNISTNLWSFVSPVLLLLGNFGNVMTIIIMHRMKSGEAVFNIYFTALAIIDTVTLNISLLNEWVFLAFGFSIVDQGNAVCKLYYWITTSIPNVSGWCLVGLTIHRAVSVVWPHRVNVLCTRRLVVGLIVGMTAFFAAVYSHYLYGFQVQYYNTSTTYLCRMKSGSYLTFVNEVFTYIDLVLYSILPFTCITFANSVLVWKLRNSVRESRQTFAEKGSEQVSAREKAASSVTWTVIMVSVAYVVLTLPVSVYYVSMYVSTFYTQITADEYAKNYLLYTIVYLLMYCNNTVNFYLYCLTGERFRKEFMLLLCPKRSERLR